MDNYTAVSIAEGFCGGEDATEKEQIEAWQHLIDTGKCWTLQGWFGRTAEALIEAGICHVKSEEVIEGKIIVEVQGGVAYCDDLRVEIIDHDTR